MIKIMRAVLILLILSAPAQAENFTVKGDMDSRIHYELQHQIKAGDSMKKLLLSFVVPESFESPTYKQKIYNFDISFSPKPLEKKRQPMSAAIKRFRQPGQMFLPPLMRWCLLTLKQALALPPFNLKRLFLLLKHRKNLRFICNHQSRCKPMIRLLLTLPQN